MRRIPGLVELSRRQFCAFAGAGAAAIALGGCEDGDVGAVQTGGLGGGDDAPVDAPHGGPPSDGSVTPPPDGAVAPACTGSPIDVGAPSMFAMNTPVFNASGRFYVVRDAGGLFAVSALCTHEGAQCSVSSGRFRCPRHNALFMFDGAIISGPVVRPLVHYAMCLMSSGHVGVITSSQVAAGTRFPA